MNSILQWSNVKSEDMTKEFWMNRGHSTLTIKLELRYSSFYSQLWKLY